MKINTDRHYTPGLDIRQRAGSSLDSLIRQADSQMIRAESRRDDDAWTDHFAIWLSLLSLKHRLPWPGGAQ